MYVVHVIIMYVMYTNNVYNVYLLQQPMETFIDVETNGYIVVNFKEILISWY